MKSPETPIRKSPMLLAALLLASLAVPAAADDREGVTLFDHVHFEGHCKTFYGDVPDVRKAHFGNDRASSIVVPRGCEVTLYRDAYFRGPSITLGRDVADLSYTRVGNDEVSSLSVSCYEGRRRDRWYRGGRYDGQRYDDRRDDRRGAGVIVYADAGFRGRYETFDYADPNLRDNPIGNDTISSIKVAPGCRAVLYSDGGFHGTALVLTESNANLRYSAVGNDRVSSIRVDCSDRW